MSGIICKTSADQFLAAIQLTEMLKTDPESAVFDLALELIHSAERRPGDTHARTREGAAMAGADEFVLLVYPAQPRCGHTEDSTFRLPLPVGTT